MSDIQINLTARYQVAGSQITWQEFDDELIVIDLGSGVYYSLNAAAGTIWNAMLAGYSPAEAAASLGEASLRAWTEFCSHGLIRPVVASDNGSIEAAPGREPIGNAPVDEPSIEVYEDMQDLFLLDPIHDVDEAGWPAQRQAQ